ncbi:MAG: sugar ABC transporter ATP-binding protein [Verrucomicrobia bacterium]|nr:sugar ABC transporter ATP-binding protein [Verrucomicrobiota bacterium]
MADASDGSLLEVRELTKRFPGVLALRGVSLRILPGEVLAVIGENGAGKSTLMKILAGVQKADSGEILLNGKAAEIASVRDAIGLGIVLIHQELNLSDNLDIGANIFLGREPSRFGWMDKRRIHEASRPVLDRIGLRHSPGTLVSQLSIGQQQMVEIAKALSSDARILIMDEPTSSLSHHEAAQLFAVVRQLRSNGVSIVYISHRLGEVKELADRVVVLRDGANAGELGREEISHDQMVKLMVGRDVSQFYQHVPRPKGEVALEVRDLRTSANPSHSINLHVCGGEIVGLAGLVGAGRTELLRSVFAIDPFLEGEIRVAGKRIDVSHPRDAIHAGIGLVPEDRKEQGLVLEMAVRENLSLPSLRRDQKNGFLNRAEENRVTTQMIRDLNIKTPGPEQVVQYLSGGNQQKVVLGKWLAMNPKVLLLDEPTRGIDVGAKREIYRLMEQLAETGVAVLFVSSEMEEILGMSDRALVMHEGRITGELSRGELSEEAVMHLATGRIHKNQEACA